MSLLIRAETLETFESPDKEPTMANIAEAILHYGSETNEKPKSSDYMRVSVLLQNLLYAPAVLPV